MTSFDLLTNLKFAQCLDCIEHELSQTTDTEEVSKLLIIANIALMQEGSENILGQRPIWFTESLEQLKSTDTQYGTYYPVLLSIEASRLFESNNTEFADSLFHEAKSLSKSNLTNATILFSEGIYKLNHFHTPDIALKYFDEAINIFNKSEQSELFLYFHYYTITMRLFALMLLGNNNLVVKESLALIDDIKNAKYFPLLENCYLNIAQAYTDLKDSKNAFVFLDKNISMWEKSNNEKRIAVGLTIAAVSAISLSDIVIAQQYLEKRKKTWVPLDLHWNMISNAFKQNGFLDQAKEWKWNSDYNATSA